MESDNTLPMPEFDNQEEFTRQNETITPPYYAVPPKPPSKFNKFFKIGLLVAGVVLVLILFVFFILGRNKSTTGGGSNQGALVYWGVLKDSSAMQQIISDFEKENPDIKIDYVQQDISTYRDRLTTRINNGTGPDIFSFHNTWFPMLSNVLLPLPSTTISVKDFSSLYYPVATKDLVRNGSVYGVPLEIDTLALYINSSMFKAAGLNPPTNWNDFASDARILTVKDTDGKIKTAGAAIGTYDNVDYAPDILSMLFVQNGVDLGNISQGTKEITDALTYYTSFVTDPTTSVWDNTLDPSTLAFSKGNLAMYFGYSRDYLTIKTNNPSLNFQIVPAPQLTGQDKTIASYWAEGVSAKTTHQKEALTFIKYLTREDVESKLYAAEVKTKGFGEPLAKTNMAITLSSNPNVYPFISQASVATSSYFAFGTDDNGLNQQTNAFLQNAIDSMLINNTGADAAADALSKGVTSVLSQYGQ